MTKELTILEVAEYLKNEDHFRTIQKGIGPTNQIVWRDFDEFEPHSFWIIQDFRWRFKPIKEEIDDLLSFIPECKLNLSKMITRLEKTYSCECD